MLCWCYFGAGSLAALVALYSSTANNLAYMPSRYSCKSPWVCTLNTVYIQYGPEYPPKHLTLIHTSLAPSYLCFDWSRSYVWTCSQIVSFAVSFDCIASISLKLVCFRASSCRGHYIKGFWRTLSLPGDFYLESKHNQVCFCRSWSASQCYHSHRTARNQLIFIYVASLCAWQGLLRQELATDQEEVQGATEGVVVT